MFADFSRTFTDVRELKEESSKSAEIFQNDCNFVFFANAVCHFLEIVRNEDALDDARRCTLALAWLWRDGG